MGKSSRKTLAMVGFTGMLDILGIQSISYFLSFRRSRDKYLETIDNGYVSGIQGIGSTDRHGNFSKWNRDI